MIPLIVEFNPRSHIYIFPSTHDIRLSYKDQLFLLDLT